MSKPNHRAVAGTKRARQLAAQNSRIRAVNNSVWFDPEQQAWNARIDAERAAKKLAKLELKGKI